MITLRIGNSESQISGLDAAQLSKLRSLLSYTPHAAPSKFGWAAKKRPLMDKAGRFPSGLVYLVRKFFKENNLIVDIKDTRRAPQARKSLFDMRLQVTPYDDQENAAAACLKAHRGIVSAPTGLGKSIIVGLIIQKLQVPTLVVVPNLSLKTQLTASLKSWFGDDKVGGQKENTSIVVENIDALNPGKVLKGYDCVIIDEFHHAAANTYRQLNKKSWNDVYYRFGLTATPFRSQDGERLLLESFLSEIIYQVSYTKAVDKGYIVPVEAYYVELPASVTGSTRWPGVYSDLVVNNKPRNKIIASLIKNLNDSGLCSLTLVKEIAHGKILSDLTKIMFANGKDEDTSDMIHFFSQDKLKCLIGTNGVIGEGVDTKPCEYVIIAGLGKSKNAFMQQVGRAVRRFPGKESAKIILFYDKSHRWTKAHFKAQVKILADEYGVKPVKLVFDV